MGGLRLVARRVGRILQRLVRPAVMGLLAAASGAAPLQAVIFYGTGDPNHNTTAPTGALAGSGWQWVGAWGNMQGTPIGPRHFLAARHVGGAIGGTFVFSGVSYTTTAFFDDTASDLRIWEVSGTFPTWASIYRGSSEVGQSLVVFGRGLPRGEEVRNGANELRGWKWGASDGRLRWGTNAIHAVVNGGATWGPLLYALFNATAGPNEAHLAQDDSSGPVFIQDGAAWKLAGVAAVVDAYFNTTNTGDGFNAAIFDRRGLYYGSAGNWNLISGGSPVASGFYATRVSVRSAWIDSIVPPVDPPPSPPSPTPVPALSTAWSLVLAVMVAVTSWVAMERKIV